MTLQRGEKEMWIADSDDILSQMTEFAIRRMNRPQLCVMIPRRNVKVPHLKTKKIQQLLCRPRDPNASQSLLMIAPATDPRYRNMLRNDLRSKFSAVETNTFYPITTSFSPKAKKIVACRKATEAPWPISHATLNRPEFPVPGYLQQLSTFAAMAYSSCSKASEDVRKFYQLSQDPFAFISYASPFMTSDSGIECRDYPKLAKVDSRRQSMFRSSDPFYHSCHFGSCGVSQQPQAALHPQRRPGNIYESIASRVVTNDHQCKMTSLCSRMEDKVARLKRTWLPTDSCPQPAKKFISTAHYPKPLQISNLNAFAQRDIHAYTTNKLMNDVTDTSQCTSNFIFPPSLQLPASSFTSSSSSSNKSRDLTMTPSFDNPQSVLSSRVGSGASTCLFSGINKIVQPQALNAVE